MLKNGVNLKRGIKALAVVFAIGYIFSFSQVEAATTIGANITTGGYLMLNTSATPAGVNGTIHFDGTKFRCYEGGVWVDCIGGISGTVLVNQGGTNITSYTGGDLLYATGATTLSKLAIGASGQILTSNGSAPVWTNTDPLVLTNTYVHADLDGSADDCTGETNALVGDVCIVTGTSKSYVLQTAPYSTVGNWTELLSSSTAYLLAANNLSDLTNATTARNNLDLGVLDTPNFAGLDFTPGVAPAYGEGRVYYDSTLKSLSYYNDHSTVPVNIGQKNILRVENNSGSAISYGQIVYISGAGTGGIPAVDLAQADDAATSKVLGFAAENIASGSQGYITAYGMLTGLNTAGYSDGVPVYLSATVAGGMTATKPIQPAYEVPVGYIGDAAAFPSGTILAFVVPKLTTTVNTGGISFGNADGYLVDDVANLFWDDTTKRLGIGTNTPAYALDINNSIKADTGIFYLSVNNGAPAGVPVNGAMYYDTSSDIFKCYENSVWKDCDTSAAIVADSLDFTDFSDTMAVDAVTTIDLGANNLSITSAGAGVLTLTSGGAATWGTGAGNLNLAVNGAATGNVQIGTGAGVTTPDFLVLDLKSDAEGALAGTNGAMYYNSISNKFRCYENGIWVNCVASTGSAVLSSITAAVAPNSINNGGNAQTWNWNLVTPADDGKSGITFGENMASTGIGASIVNVSNMAGSTAVPLMVNNHGTANSFTVEDEPADTTPFVITQTGQVGIGTDTFTVGNTEKLKVEGVIGSGNVIAGYGSVDEPLYINVQNRNSGSSAVSAFAAGADDTTDTTNYVAAGITSSSFADPAFPIAGHHEGFIFTVGDGLGSNGGNMIIGTSEPGMSIKFIAAGGVYAESEQMRIDGNGNVGIGTTSPGARLDIAPSPSPMPWITPTEHVLRIQPYGAVAGNTGNFELMELVANGSNYVGLKAPDSIASDIAWTLPSADGSAGQALVTDGSAGLSWASASSNWQKVATTLSPLTAGDDVTTSGDIYTSGTGVMTSAGLLTGQLGLTVTGAGISLNSGATAASNFNTSINEGTSTGTVTIGNAAAGAIGITSGSGLTLTGGATSTWGTSTGDLNLAVNGAGSGNVQIGTGVASATPDLLVFDSGSAEPSGTNGAMYYNTGTNNFRCYINGSWIDCASARLSSLNAATASNSINNGDNAQTWNWNLTNNNKSGITFGENTASTGTGTSIVNVANLTSSTAVPLEINNVGAVNSFRVNDSATTDTTPFIINEDGNVAIGATSFNPTNPEKLKVEAGTTSSINVISGYGDIDNYLQLNIRNRNAGGSASSDLVATADNGDENVYYLDMGINSSGYNDPGYTIGGPNDAYILAQGGPGVGGNLAIGTGTAGTLIKFYTGGSDASNEKMRIEDSGNVGIGTTSLNARLDISPATADALRIEPYGAVGGNTGGLEFMELVANGSNYVGFKAPDNIAANIAWTLPNADGTSGQMLATDGAGVLSWASATGVWQRVGTTLSPTTLGDAVTSDGLLTGQLGLTITGAGVSLNDGTSNFNTTINTGTSTGTVTIGNSAAGAIGITAGTGAALTLTGGTSSSLATTAGNIKFQPAGTGTTGYVKIGEGQTGSTTPDLLALDVTSVAFGSGDPAGSIDDGSMYYNEAANKFRCRINGSWSDCDTTGGTVTMQSAYNNGATITTAVSTDIGFVLTSGNFTASGAGSVNLTPTGASSFTSGAALTLTGGAASTWSTSSGALTITSALAATWGTAAGDLTLQAAGTGTANVKIGTGGTGSLTPDLFAVDVKSTTGDPLGGYNGAMYYNNADAVFRCYEAGGWKNCGSSAASATTLQQAYTAGPTISTSGSNIAFTLNTTDQFTASGAGSVNLTPTGASSFTSGAALTLTAGAGSTWSTSSGALTVDSAAGLNLGTVNATGITIGKAGVTTTNIGTLQTGNGATSGSFKIADGSTNFVTLTSPAIVADYTLTLPVDDGTSGQALTTDGSGNLSWTGITGNLMTTEGDMLYHDAVGNARLPRGTNGQILQSSATTVGWVTPTGATVGLGNVTNDAQIPKAIGTAKGDMIAYTASNTPVRLPVGGTNGWVLMVDATQATGMKWAANTPVADSLDFTEFSDAMTVDANTSINLAGQSLTINDLTGGGALSMTTNAAALTLTAGAASTWSTTAGALTINSGTTTPAALNLGTAGTNAINIGASGVTTTNIGTLQTGNAATAGSFKIADGTANYITLNSPAISSDYTLTLPVDDGTIGQALTTNGTGTLAWSTVFADPMTTRGDIILRDAANTTNRLAVGTSGQVLRSNGTDPSWTTLTSSDVGLANVTNDAQIRKAIGTAKGDLIAYTASNTPVRLPIGALDGYILTVDGTQGSGMKWAPGIPGGTTNNSTIRYDTSGTPAWVENTAFTVTSGGTTSIAAGQSYTGVGAVTLSSGAATALTVTGNAASTWSTTAGALTLTSAAAATWSTTAGNLTLQAGSGTVSLGTSTSLTASGALAVTSGTATALTIDSGTTGNLLIGTDASAETINIGTGSAAKTLTLGSTNTTSKTTIQSGTGNIELKPASTGVVTIGTSDTVGTSLVLDIKTDAGDPAGTNGAMYYNSNESKFKCYEAGAWKDCITSGTISLQTAYNNGATITTAGGNAITFTTPIGSNNAGLVITQNNTTNNPVALQIINAGTGNDITATNWSITKNGVISTSGNITATGGGAITSAGLLTGQAGLTVSGGAINLNTSGTGNTAIGNATGTFTLTSAGLNVTSGLVSLKPFGAAAGNTTEQRFLELAANGINYTGFKAPDALGGNTIYVMPSTDPTAGQVLSSTAPIGGVATLSWTSVGGSGTVTSVSGGTTGLTFSNPTTTPTMTGTLAVANGGTNSTATPTNGGVSYGTGSAYAFTAAGTTGQVLTSNGAGAPTWSSLSGIGAVTSGYGELYETGGGTVTVTTAGTFYPWTTSVAGECSGGTLVACSVATDNMTVGSTGAGRYLIAYAVSFTQTNNHTVTSGVGINGTVDPKSKHEWKVTSTGNAFVISGTFIANLAATNVVDLRFTSSTNGDVVNILHADLNMQKIN